MIRTLGLRSAMLAGTLAVLGMVTSARADLVTNGGFEVPLAPPGGFVLVAAGSPALTGWTIGTTVPNDILLHSTTYTESGNGMSFNAQSGIQALDITGAGPSSTGNSGPGTYIEQTLTTIVGQLYELSFWLGHAASNNGSPLYVPSVAAAVEVSIGGGAGTVYTNGNITSGQVNWVNYTQRFTATGTSTALRFTTAPPTNGPNPPNYSGLDSISVNAIPEPGPLTLCAAGLPLFLGLSWFRSRRAAR